LILVSLAEGPKHGYAMIDDIAAIADAIGARHAVRRDRAVEARGLIAGLKSDDRRTRTG
jgi:hypothetical protein